MPRSTPRPFSLFDTPANYLLSPQEEMNLLGLPFINSVPSIRQLWQTLLICDNIYQFHGHLSSSVYMLWSFSQMCMGYSHSHKRNCSKPLITQLESNYRYKYTCSILETIKTMHAKHTSKLNIGQKSYFSSLKAVFRYHFECS